ncbi:trypsin-like peptidase domain-containing protein [Streptomyces sp. CL12-4]|uniref:trypsin-like peptidase domain-containing protein n=1 Tax=Streptomyces sp. CL12-4 TaxID=2810306 RepID=UPI001EFBC6D2|nr:trypsin-like peptidase domain-containing protein [Streptomyces sp. CL12-4]MCG8964240.1 trypsin-like peptidase domain-containing protein [Streptomyces sp. CL12-4]
MNEGKPTKAKWWSRPRPSGDGSDGDFELARPRAAHGTADAEPDGGDFPLKRPEAPRAAGERDHGGDYELDGPAARPVEPTTDTGAAPGAAPATVPEPRTATDAPGTPGTDTADAAVAPDAHAAALDAAGTGAGAAPAGPGALDAAVTGPDALGGAGTSAYPGAPDARGAVGTDAADALSVPGTPTGTGADTPAALGDPRADDTPASAPVAERPRPLHDPDPYSTPPYGEPGPWAPAPPVQHPATTPAHGTTAPVHGATAPPASAAAPAGPAAAPSGTPMPDPAYADAPPPAPPLQHPVTAPLTPATATTAGTPAAPGTSEPSPPPGAAPPPGTPAPDPWRRYDPWAVAAAGPLQQNGAPAGTREQRRGRARRTLVVGTLLIALVSGGVGGAVGAYLERHGGMGTVELPQAGREPADRAPDSVAGIAARALPSVVTLHVSGSDAAGTGTGFVLDGSGHILTNNHVVEPAGNGGEITVTFNSGDTAEATVVGRDSGYDLAVVKVKGVDGLTPMPLGNSDNVQVGDPVVAIGAPFDLAGTVTSGIISAKERPITAGGEESDGSDVSYVDALQTDAPINPGNSGGPLLDAQGRAIGINSAIRSADSGAAESDGGQAGSIGLGFAIPINQGKRVAEELINTGRATHPVIGITLDMGYTGDGARVGTQGSDGGPPVTAGGPGADAGLKAGDVITEVDGRRVHSGEELIVKTRAHRPGDRLQLTVERQGRETNVSLVLGSSDGG